jgi:hypothetical protein
VHDLLIHEPVTTYANNSTSQGSRSIDWDQHFVTMGGGQTRPVRIMDNVLKRARNPIKRLRLGVALGFVNSLSQLTRLYGGTDKWIHGYMPYYERHLGPRRFHRQLVIEIGVGNVRSMTPGGSLRVWRDTLLRSVIVGIDIEPKSFNLGRRVHFEQAHQGNHSDLQRVVDNHGRPDIVIDDGSHLSDDLLASFEFFWPLLARGGMYVIEDLSASYYPSLGGGDPPPESSAVGLLRLLVDCVQREDPTFVRRPTWGTRSAPRHGSVGAVHVYPGIAFIEKTYG